MPVQINKIFSDIQTEIDDLAMEKVQLGEYIDLMNDLAIDIAQETQIWIARYTTVPNPSAMTWQLSFNYTTGMFVLGTDGNYYMCIVNHTSSLLTKPITGANYLTNWQIVNQWTAGISYVIGAIVWDSGPLFWKATQSHTSLASNEPPDPVYWERVGGGIGSIYGVQLPYSMNNVDLAPFRIIRVVRGAQARDEVVEGVVVHIGQAWRECREYSPQSIGSTISQNPSFTINHTQLGDGEFSTQHVNLLGQVDGSVSLIFGGAFYANEEVVIDFISNRPFASNPLNMWDPNAVVPISVPDFLQKSFKWGLKWLVCERLFSKGDDRMRNIADRAEVKYHGSDMHGGFLREAAGYARNFLDKGSAIKMQPINWFEE